MLGFFSCGKEAVEPIVNDISVGENVSDRTDDPFGPDCFCELQIIGVENPPIGAPYDLVDITNGMQSGVVLVEGYENSYISGLQFYPYPSPLELISTPNPIFYIAIGTEEIPAGFTINVRIVCTSFDSHGNPTQTQQFHDFVWKNATDKTIGNGFASGQWVLPFDLDC